MTASADDPHDRHRRAALRAIAKYSGAAGAGVTLTLLSAEDAVAQQECSLPGNSQGNGKAKGRCKDKGSDKGVGHGRRFGADTSVYHGDGSETRGGWNE